MLRAEQIWISIHALREEGDLAAEQCEEVSGCISIHALREEGDTDYRLIRLAEFDISIHALREEGDFLQTTIYTK